MICLIVDLGGRRDVNVFLARVASVAELQCMPNPVNELGSVFFDLNQVSDWAIAICGTNAVLIFSFFRPNRTWLGDLNQMTGCAFQVLGMLLFN